MLSFDYSPLFLYVLTSLIKLIFGSSFSTDKRWAEDLGIKDCRVLLRFTKTVPFESFLKKKFFLITKKTSSYLKWRFLVLQHERETSL